ncbi:MAG: Uma2 family endonuclease [bacterium]|nr:Uma2 family endonuclease [bacterium]
MSVLTDLDPDVAYPATPSVPESDLHSLVRFLCYGALRGHFAGHRGCFVGQDLNIYYRRGDRTFVAPDVFVCFDVDPRHIQTAASYRLWDVGAPPSFVLEIASEKTYEKDLHDKPATYLEMGVSEYWRFDPSDLGLFAPILQGDRRAGDAWAPIAVGADDGGGLRGHSSVLGLDLHAEGRRLRFRDPQSGRWLADPDEARHALDATLHTLDLTRRERDAEAAARRAAEAEVAALRARLGEQA